MLTKWTLIKIQQKKKDKLNYYNLSCLSLKFKSNSIHYKKIDFFPHSKKMYFSTLLHINFYAGDKVYIDIYIYNFLKVIMY